MILLDVCIPLLAAASLLSYARGYTSAPLILALSTVLCCAGYAVARKCRTAPPRDLVRIGGRMVDRSQWPADIVERLKAQYFQPGASREYLVRADLSCKCPSGHMVRERLGVIGRDAKVTLGALEALFQRGMLLRCDQCGSGDFRVTGKAVAWQGRLEDWDGAT